MLRGNSKLRRSLEEAGIRFLEHGAAAIGRILPHVQVSAWQERGGKQTGCVWTSSRRDEIRITLGIGHDSGKTNRSLTAFIKRRSISAGGSAKLVLDLREHDICKRVAFRITEVLRNRPISTSASSIQAIQNAFDEHVVAQHVEAHHEFALSVGTVLDALHKLSEQSYESKAVTFGCILDPRNLVSTAGANFPGEFVESKKYKALSDGFRTAYYVSSAGKIVDFVDLTRFGKKEVTEKHHFPDWAEDLARGSRNRRCGIALSRQGDILVFDEGSLRFTYRFGRWQYWNHAHLINLLRDRARAQKVPKKIVGRVIGAIYRAALDVSFRRSGGLFVILHNRNLLHEVVRPGDAIGDLNRSSTDKDFDSVVRENSIQALPRSVAVELASLDGAIVLENSGRILAYGAVLQPRKTGRLHGSEGSRTKAAIGASNYGLAIKISSDGDVTAYHKGRSFIRI